MKKVFILVSIISIFINIYFLFGVLNTVKVDTLASTKKEYISKDIPIDNKNFNLKEVSIGTGILNVIEPFLRDFCSKENSRNLYEIFKKFTESERKIFINTLIPEGAFYPILQSNQIYYLFDDCSPFIKNADIYNECTIKKNEKIIFSQEITPIQNIPGVPIDFLNIQKIVQNGTCSLLNEDKNFKRYIPYCQNKDEYIKYLNQIYKDIGEFLCQK